MLRELTCGRDTTCRPACGRQQPSGPKSRAGKRGIGLPDPLVALLRRHRIKQQEEREAACDLWQESGYVFTTPTGGPLNPRTDYTDWKRLPGRAGVPERRLHDARHTAATVPLLLGVTERTVMSVMGWSSTAMAARYQHVIASIRRDVATRVGGLLRTPPVDPTTGPGEAGGSPTAA
ncbi:tyrosine-type recombinase/integrase [Pseudonocardia sp. GCM10023141]|uniref:tyrosine-type recombinase/integrase n=1 Tax=Pseudonocardia sp. GCM10023141 TaxID=3252653 RepID=UPI0036138C1F